MFLLIPHEIDHEHTAIAKLVVHEFMPLHIDNANETSSTVSYAALEVQTIINAAGSLSRLGGSVISPGVSEAMKEAAMAATDNRAMHI